MPTSTVFTHNGTQAVLLPSEARFPDSVRRVEVRVVGQERVVAPAGSTWDSFFLAPNAVTDDFMVTRATHHQAGRNRF